MDAEIRELKIGEEDKFIDLLKEIDSQTKFLRYEPGERKTSKDRVKEVIENDFETFIVASLDQHFIGYIMALGNTLSRKRHSADLVLAVLEEYRGKGTGRKLMEAAELWGKSHGIHRLELSVRVVNTRAVDLYKSLGYQIEGLKKDSTFTDGKYFDDYEMAKLI